MTDIVMPKLSDSMQEGTIISWLKASGDHVQAGEEILEIETDKATVAHAAEAAGVLDVVVEEGTTVAVGEVIARIGAPTPAAEANGGEPTPAAEANGGDPTPAGSSGVVVPEEAAAPVRGNGRRRVPATPLARRVAEAHGVAVDEIEGTGPLGRITRSDVLRRAGIAPEPSERRAAPPRQAQAPPAGEAADPALSPAASAPASAGAGAVRREPTRLQQVIARRMAEAKATIPHFQVQTEVAMDAVTAMRAELRGAAGDAAPVPSVNDFIVKAAALALIDHPLANGSYRDGAFELHEAINIGVAVAADDALVVPTVFDAAAKSLGQIARDTRSLAARVRSGEITPPELSGATFTVSNLGMFGMTAITPVINPPQAAILGVGATRETLARVDGEIVDRALLTLTLSCDHRILYGADAARFLAQIRALLEVPLRLAL